ncbi:MAG: hypothetical protein MPJ50_07460 [Pirellulales bacterium]|nr:hypothetical protein [Pirellulales bacterium]
MRSLLLGIASGVIVIGFVVSDLSSESSVQESRAERPTRPLQSGDNVRVTLLSVNHGVTFRGIQNGVILESHDENLVHYVSALFLVEKLGQPRGDNGEIVFRNPQGKIDFSASEWGPTPVENFRSRLSDFWTNPVAVPDNTAEGTETLVYKTLQMRTEPFSPPTDVSAVFFGERFKWRLPQ